MININSTAFKKEENSKIKSKVKSHNIQSRETFESVLDEKITFDFEGAIDELFTDLKKQEDQFLSNQDFYNLNKYKAIVEKLLKKILNEGFETAKLKRLRRDKADFLIINKINSKLQEIIKEITNKQNKAFNLMKSVEEIRGMILDLIY